ncbi:MAG: hypothetical protein U1E26_07235 [Coriobacteriia bacterium]|nr:hypothetical protein [Coriobacteriia bacterium]
MKIIGAADDFWRVRLTRVDSTDAADFEWRDDILYRTPPEVEPQESERWRIEAVRLDDYEAVVSVGVLEDRAEAEAILERAQEDLLEMTKAQFEDAYLTPSPAPDTDEDPTA